MALVSVGEGNGPTLACVAVLAAMEQLAAQGLVNVSGSE
jgi:hypothetical protein